MSDYLDDDIYGDTDLDDDRDSKLKGTTVLSELQQANEYLQALSKSASDATATTRTLIERNYKGSVFRIVERDISYIDGSGGAADIFYAQQLGMKYRRVEAILNGGQIFFDGANYLASSGPDLKFNPLSLDPKSIISGFLNKQQGDSFFKQSIIGHGNVWLKDTTSFLEVLPLTSNKIIMEKGTYFASMGDFKLEFFADTKISSMLFSKKQLITTSLVGSGFIILELPVRKSELIEIQISHNKPAWIDPNVVLFRVGNVNRGEKLSNGIFGSAINGTGLVETYTGQGSVFIAPTLNKLYDIEDLGYNNRRQHSRGQE